MVITVVVPTRNIWGERHRPMPWRARSEPPAGSRGRVPDGQGVRRQSPHEAEALLAFRRSMEVSNLPTFLKFGNAKIRYLCYLCKKPGWLRNWGPGAKLGEDLCPLGPDLEPPLGLGCILWRHFREWLQ